MKVMPISSLIGSSFHDYLNYYRRNVLDQFLNEALVERRYKMNVGNRLDSTNPDYLRHIEESKKYERKQETRNLMNEERDQTQKATDNVVRSNIGTIIDVYA